MEEIKILHDLNLEWGCITNLMDKIIAIEGQIEGGWPELGDMLGDAMTEEGCNKDPVSAFFHLYGFMFHLYFRLKANPTKQPFNRFSYDERTSQYYITNYDYKLYKWAIEKGFKEWIDNLTIIIPKEKLTDKEIASMDERCK